MLVIKFSVYNQRLRKITSGIIPADAYGQLKFEFDFRTDDWKEIKTKTVNFNYRGENYFVDLNENNQCLVPERVIYSPSFSVAIHGGDIVTNYVRNFVENVNPRSIVVRPPSSNSAKTGLVFIPTISEDKILTWTIGEDNGGLKVPNPVDLNPFDEWTETGNEVETDYLWEPMQ